MMAIRAWAVAGLVLWAWASPLAGQEPTQAPLRTGAGEVVGMVEAWNHEAVLSVRIECLPGWTLGSSKLAIADSPAGIPVNPAGRPVVGKFELKQSHKRLSEFTWEVATTDVAAGDELVLALHVELFGGSPSGLVLGKATAWAGTEAFACKGGAVWFFRHVWSGAEEPPTPFLTLTQEDWSGYGADYLDASFNQWFPEGMVLGDAVWGNTIRFTSGAAVAEFLPQTGAPGQLQRNYLNPATTEAGALAGELVALTLNVVADLADPELGASERNLSALVVDDPASPFYGFTVSQVLNEVHNSLGMFGWFTPGEAAECARRINENFAGGGDTGFLR